MTRAAQRLQLAQPALSQAIARLEAQVGVRLLDRGPRGVTVTEAGEAFLEKAEATLAAVEDMNVTARAFARERQERVRAGFMSLTPPMMAGGLFPRFNSEHPEVTIEWRQLGYPTLDARAWLGDCDLALIWFAPDTPGLASQAIRTSPLVVAMAESHRLASRSRLTVEDVLDETFPGIVGCEPGWLGHWGLDAYRGGPARRTEDRATTPEEVTWMVAAGRAITTVPEIVAAPYAHLGIRAVPLLGAEPAVLTLVWSEGRPHPVVAELALIAREMSAQGRGEAAPPGRLKTRSAVGRGPRESSPSHVDHTSAPSRRS
jgi:DNA-binding transcriptional LysR family regulator